MQTQSRLLSPALILLVVAGACSSRKSLTPKTAKALIQEFMEKQDNAAMKAGMMTIDDSGFSKFLNEKSLIDYKTWTPPADDTEAIQFQRLVKAGLVTQAAEAATFPNLTGNYETNGDYDFHPLALSMQQGSSSIQGTCRYVMDPKGFKTLARGSFCAGTVVGHLTADGAIELHFRPTSDFYCPVPFAGTYDVNPGDDGIGLEGPGRMRLYRKGSPGTINLTTYTYAFSPKFQTFVVPPNQVKVGRYRVDSVENVLHAADGIAQANYKFHVDLNEVGEAIVNPRDNGSGRGTMMFHKQPDGEWICVGAKPETPPGMIPVSWAKSLGVDSLAGIDARLKEPWDQTFDVMVKDDLFTITDCADYWKVARGKWDVTNPLDQGPIQAYGLDCEALRLLRDAKPTRAADPFELNAESASVLPPGVGPVVSNDDVRAVQAAVKAGKSWKTLDPSVRGKLDETDHTVVEFRNSNGMLARLKELGRGDFTGHGSQEILLQSITGALQGSYAAEQLILLGRDGDKPVLVALKIPPITSH